MSFLHIISNTFVNTEAVFMELSANKRTRNGNKSNNVTLLEAVAGGAYKVK